MVAVPINCPCFCMQQHVKIGKKFLRSVSVTLTDEIKKKLEKAFDKKQAAILSEVITDAYIDLVKTGDFNELKGIVRDLGIKVGELAEAQRRTEQRVEELAEAQRRTEIKIAELSDKVVELTEAQKRTEIEVAKLAKGLHETRGELGGLSKSMGYAFENEAFRRLPGILKEKYQIEMTEKLIREEIKGKEINIFGKARRNGTDVFIVGESKLRLDERREKKVEEVLTELEDKVEAVKEEFGDVEVVRILITHYATKGFLKKAKDRGIIVVQSFEW